MALAAADYRKVLRHRPGLPEACCNLGSVLLAEGQPDLSAACLRRALAAIPQSAVAYANLGAAERGRDRPQQALTALGRALLLAADYANAAISLGLVLQDLGRLDDAVALFRRAIALSPGPGLAHNNLGSLHYRCRRLEQAADSLYRAVAVAPEHAVAHVNLSAVLLTRGDLAAGFRENEWRWRMPMMQAGRQDDPAPLWTGEAGQGRTLLIQAEQGLGDTLQFCRYAPLAAARGWRVVLAVQPPLVRLLEGLPGVGRVVSWLAAAEPCHARIPMMSLPHVFATRLDTIPAGAYLRVEPGAAEAWRRRLRDVPGPKVGVVWAGAPRPDPLCQAVDGRRSMRPEMLAPLLACPGVRFFSLQKDGPPAPPALIDHMGEMADFADTAALVSALDLVISVDTSMVHLAGAMGKPVWMLDRFDSCWRWLENRDDSPWYPTLRIFRQPAPGDWPAVVERVTTALAAL